MTMQSELVFTGPMLIELLSRTKPCLKIMLSETELKVIAGG